LGRLARHDRRVKKKVEAEKIKKFLFVPKPVHPPRTVNPLKFEPSKTGMFPEVYLTLGFLRKGAKVNILPKSLKQRKRLAAGYEIKASTSRRTIQPPKREVDSYPVENQNNNTNYQSSRRATMSDNFRNDTVDEPDEDALLFSTVVNYPESFPLSIGGAGGNDSELPHRPQHVYPPPPPQLLKPQPHATAPVIIDSLVLAEEIHTGRYPSMNRYEGRHDTTCLVCKAGGGGNGYFPEHQLFLCEFCSNSEHMACLKSRVTIQDIDPECDDFMCHKCIQTVVARRVRAEGRRLDKRTEALEKAGFANNPFYNANASMSATATASATAAQKEVDWSEREFESHEVSFEPCPFGGLGGLVCCAHCTDVYSRFLSVDNLC
jgi:hypothetical protein